MGNRGKSIDVIGAALLGDQRQRRHRALSVAAAPKPRLHRARIGAAHAGGNVRMGGDVCEEEEGGGGKQLSVLISTDFWLYCSSDITGSRAIS